MKYCNETSASALVVKILFTQTTNALLLSGNKIIPQRLLDLPYSFKYPTIKKSLTVILRK